MKNLKNVENTSGISELNSVEMNEIMGGGFFSKVWQWICDAYYDLVVSTELSDSLDKD
jgi:hypothetical protein